MHPVGRRKELPNIIIIFADDMGYGDVSFFNADSKIQTPSIDFLAENGLSFTNAHSSGSVCTPSRYGLLTGLSMRLMTARPLNARPDVSMEQIPNMAL